MAARVSVASFPRPGARPAPGARLARRVGWRHWLWRCWPAAAPRLRLAPRVRPQSRPEIALCALFSCQREWSAPELVARLAWAPAPDAAPARGEPARLGGQAAWRLLAEWLARGVLTVAPR